MKAVVAAFNQVKALVGAFSVITNLRMELFEALMATGQVGEGAGGASLPLADTRPSPEFYKHFHTRKYLG